MKCVRLTLAMLCLSFLSYAQEKCPVNFDKVSPADFVIENNQVDTSFGAVILADVGSSSFDANKKGYFSIIFKVKRRIKIISSKGFDLATVKIALYKDVASNREEMLEDLKASTYNLTNGKIEETKLDKNNVFREVQSKDHLVKKFTMPAVKEGSIIDISYTITSDFLFNLQSWQFQGFYPRLWSEYNLSLPEFFKYVFLVKGKSNFYINDQKKKFQSFMVRTPSKTHVLLSDELTQLNSNNSTWKWVMKDVDALKEENFTSSIDNHIAGIEFQMSGRQFPGDEFQDIMGSWAKANTELLTDKEFGASFSENEEWTKNALKTILTEGQTELEKAKSIYYFLQKKVSTKGTKGIRISQPLRETYNSKTGYVADANLLLTLLLKRAGLNAYPVLISTRSNGFANANYPLINQYNYVICKIEMSKENYYLDASKTSLGFGKIPSYCFNGYGALIDLPPASEMLFPDTLLENKYTSVMLLIDQENKSRWTGNFNSTLGYYESQEIRENITEKGQEKFEKRITDAYTGEYSAGKLALQNLNDNEKPINLLYNIALNMHDANIIYLNPLLNEGLKENYFRSADRKYPVELPFKINETYNFHLEIPEGYIVEEVPKSTRVSLNEADGMFEYIISKDQNNIMLKSTIKINKTVFMNDEYETLKGFFDYVVKKHAEQIVLKKK